MHSKLLLIVVVGWFACLAVPAAFASQRVIQQIPFESHGITQTCGFPVQLDAAGTVVDISYTDALGSFHDFEASPQVKQTMTNLLTGKRIVVTISGPANFTFGSDGGISLVGTGLWSWTSGDPATLEPGLFLTSGRFVFSISATGVPTWSSTGSKINLCSELA